MHAIGELDANLVAAIDAVSDRTDGAGGIEIDDRCGSSEPQGRVRIGNGPKSNFRAGSDAVGRRMVERAVEIDDPGGGAGPQEGMDGHGGTNTDQSGLR